VPGYEVIVWFGLIGPKGLPRPIVDRINGEVMAWLKLRETGEQLQADGSSPAGGTPEQFLARIKQEIPLWREVARKGGLAARMSSAHRWGANVERRAPAETYQLGHHPSVVARHARRTAETAARSSCRS